MPEIKRLKNGSYYHILKRRIPDFLNYITKTGKGTHFCFIGSCSIYVFRKYIILSTKRADIVMKDLNLAVKHARSLEKHFKEAPNV